MYALAFSLSKDYFMLLCKQYPDGDRYLTMYNFEHFDKNDFWRFASFFFLFNITVFALGLNGIQAFVSRVMCCRRAKYNVVDKYGIDSRVFSLTSAEDAGSKAGLVDSSGPTLNEELLGDSNGTGKKRNRLYSGIEEDYEDRQRASRDFNKQDLSFIRTNSSLAPKIFARETSVSSQTGFKTQSSYSRGFSSAGNSGSGLTI
jgi:hypothetical protein